MCPTRWSGCVTTTATSRRNRLPRRQARGACTPDDSCPGECVMATLWPWLAVAGLGALHGLSPANGWMFAAACGVRAGDGSQARCALLPIGIGHVASVAIVACAFAQGMLMDRTRAQFVAGALLVGVASYRLV